MRSYDGVTTASLEDDSNVRMAVFSVGHLFGSWMVLLVGLSLSLCAFLREIYQGFSDDILREWVVSRNV